MIDFVRVKIGGKRQVTLPQLLLERLGLHEGDELEFEIQDGVIVAVRPLALIPTQFFTPEKLALLRERAARIDERQQVKTPVHNFATAAVQYVEKEAPPAAKTVPERERDRSVYR